MKEIINKHEGVTLVDIVRVAINRFLQMPERTILNAISDEKRNSQ